MVLSSFLRPHRLPELKGYVKRMMKDDIHLDLEWLALITKMITKNDDQNDWALPKECVIKFSFQSGMVNKPGEVPGDVTNTRRIGAPWSCPL